MYQIAARCDFLGLKVDPGVFVLEFRTPYNLVFWLDIYIHLGSVLVVSTVSAILTILEPLIILWPLILIWDPIRIPLIIIALAIPSALAYIPSLVLMLSPIVVWPGPSSVVRVLSWVISLVSPFILIFPSVLVSIAISKTLVVSWV